MNLEEDITSREDEIRSKAKEQGASFDLADPLGICKNSFAGFRLCNNIGNSSGWVQWLFIAIAIGLVILGDIFDIIAWAIGWIPVVGDILGNTVLGNIIDAVCLVGLFYLIGFPAFFGIGEFLDILGFIPVLGDIAGLIEWLPAWTFAIVIYGIFMLLKSTGGGKGLQIPNILGGLGLGGSG